MYHIYQYPYHTGLYLGPSLDPGCGLYLGPSNYSGHSFYSKFYGIHCNFMTQNYSQVKTLITRKQSEHAHLRQGHVVR